MKKLAIIAEYNPFHNGHLYQLEEALRLTDAQYKVALMSGSFLQRGEAAMWSKFTRAEAAVNCGIDLVLELPVCYSTGSAHDFAYGAVNLLNKLNSIDYLCFGAECDDISILNKIADITLKECSTYKETLKTALNEGNSFALAREKAILACTTDERISEIIKQPNNILAIEYICALKSCGSNITPIVIKRKDAMYNDPSLYGNISSATAIRCNIPVNCKDVLNASNQVLDIISKDVPDASLSAIKKHYGYDSPVIGEDITKLLQHCLLFLHNSQNPYELLRTFTDVNDAIASKLLKCSNFLSYSELVTALSSKQFSETRIKRCLLHILLAYTYSDRENFFDNGYAFYANVLAMKKETSSGLKEISKATDIPIITKKADFKKCINVLDTNKQKISSRMWQLDTQATNIYNQLIYDKFNIESDNDYTTILPVI